MSAPNKAVFVVRVVAWAGLALSIIAGTALDNAPARPAEFRAGYRVLQGDFHAHTRFSDGFLSPADLVDQASRRGLDVLGVTEHNQTFPAKLARAYSVAVGGPTIVIGEEVTTRDYHLLALGIDHTIDARRPLREVIADAHAQGGLIGPAHPTHRFSKTLGPYVQDFDFVELMHPLAYQSSGIGAWSEMRDFYEKANHDGLKLTPLGDSDYHFGSILGLMRTYLFVRGDTPKDVLDAIREKRTVVFDLDGKGYGDPVLVAALENAPLTPRPQDFAYAGSGILDRVTRSIGFFSLLVLFAVGSFPRRKQSSKALDNT